jgi:DNA polymerase (family 10)
MAETWTNDRVAHLLFHIADLLEIKGENRFKVAAYRRAGEQIQTLDRPIVDIWREGNLKDVPRVGEALAKKLDELFRTGELGFLKRLEAEVPPSLATLLEVPGVGPKTARLVWEHLGIADLDALEQAARAGRLRRLPGMGEASEARILRGLQALREKGSGGPKGEGAAP